MEQLKGGQRPSKSPGRALRVNVHGLEGAGKSTLALTFPPPLSILNCDRDMGDLLELLPEHYEVNYQHAMLDVDVDKSIASRYLLLFDEIVNEALKMGEGTFIWDGYDLSWELVQVAKLPSDRSEAYAFEYADANAYMNSKLRRLGSKAINIVLISLSKETWSAEGKPTGRFISGGFRPRGRWLTHEVYLFVPERADPTERPAGAPKPLTHRAYIQKCKVPGRESLVGKVIPNLDYKTLYKLTYDELPTNHEELWRPT